MIANLDCIALYDGDFQPQTPVKLFFEEFNWGKNCQTKFIKFKLAHP